MDVKEFSLTELCVLADLPIRTVRYYVQMGLVSRPEGETRAAKYHASHLEQLLLIKKWSNAGVALDRIKALLQGEDAPIPPRPRTAGSIEVCSHVTVCDGIEIVIQPERANLTPEQVREFIRQVLQAYTTLQQ